ncbi:MAG: hypothetical protein RSD40_04665 [Bacilli bacterium]
MKEFNELTMAEIAEANGIVLTEIKAEQVSSPVLAEEVSRRVKSSPQSFGRLLFISQRLRLAFTNMVLNRYDKKLSKLNEREEDYNTFSSKDAEKIAIKRSRIEGIINICDLKIDLLKEEQGRAIKLKQEMIDSVLQTSKSLMEKGRQAEEIQPIPSKPLTPVQEEEKDVLADLLDTSTKLKPVKEISEEDLLGDMRRELLNTVSRKSEVEEAPIKPGAYTMKLNPEDKTSHSKKPETIQMTGINISNIQHIEELAIPQFVEPIHKLQDKAYALESLSGEIKSSRENLNNYIQQNAALGNKTQQLEEEEERINASIAKFIQQTESDFEQQTAALVRKQEAMVNSLTSEQARNEKLQKDCEERAARLQSLRLLEEVMLGNKNPEVGEREDKHNFNYPNEIDSSDKYGIPNGGKHRRY